MNRVVIPPGPVTDSGPTAGLACERGDLAVRLWRASWEPPHFEWLPFWLPATSAEDLISL